MALLRNGSVTARNIACITFATRYVLRETSSRGTGIHVTQDKPEYHGRGRCGADLARSGAQPDRHGRPHTKPGCAVPRHGSAVRRRTAERSRVARERLLCAYRASSAGRIGAADSGCPGCRRGGRRVGAGGAEPGCRCCRRLRVRRVPPAVRRAGPLGSGPPAVAARRHRCRRAEAAPLPAQRSTLVPSTTAWTFLLCQAFRFSCPARFRCRTIWCAKAPLGRRHRRLDGATGTPVWRRPSDRKRVRRTPSARSSGGPRSTADGCAVATNAGSISRSRCCVDR